MLKTQSQMQNYNSSMERVMAGNVVVGPNAQMVKGSLNKTVALSNSGKKGNKHVSGGFQPMAGNSRAERN